MRDIVIYEGVAYVSHLYDLMGGQNTAWAPPEPFAFPVINSACWHGYITVFSAKIGELLRPSWLLTFTPVDQAPALTLGEQTIQPQPVPEQIDGAAVPRSYRFESAYDLAGLPAYVAPNLWEVGLILHKADAPHEFESKYLLEIGEHRRFIGQVVSFRKLEPSPDMENK